MCKLYTAESWSFTEVYYIHKCNGKAFLNLILLLMFFTFDYTWRWPMAETSCDYENKNVIYIKITVMVRALFSSFCCWRCPCFRNIHGKWRRTLFLKQFDHMGKYFVLWSVKAVDVWLMDRQPFGIIKFEGSLGWHHTFASWQQVRPAFLWNVGGQGCCIFFMFY
jgi:hypothetical protein